MVKHLDRIAREYIGGLTHAHTVLSNHPSHRESDLSVDRLVAGLVKAKLAGSESAPFQYVMLNEHPSDPSKPRRLGRLSLRGRRLLRQRRRPIVKRVPVLYGLEVSILPDGSTDLTPRLADHCAMVIASRHSMPKDSEHQAATIMGHLTGACLNPTVDVIGHPPRYIEHIETVDWAQVFKIAAKTGTAIEVNLNTFPTVSAHPTQLAFWPRWLKLLAESGATVYIGTDVHNRFQLNQFILQWRSLGDSAGIAENHLARFLTAIVKAGITPEQVVSSRYDHLTEWLQLDKPARAKLDLTK